MLGAILQIPGVPGGPEVLIILVIIVFLFGANKIPKLARSSGEAIGEFQKGREEVEDELQQMREGPSSADESAFDDTTETTTDDGFSETVESIISVCAKTGQMDRGAIENMIHGEVGPGTDVDIDAVMDEIEQRSAPEVTA